MLYEVITVERAGRPLHDLDYPDAAGGEGAGDRRCQPGVVGLDQWHDRGSRQGSMQKVLQESPLTQCF